MLRLQYSMAVVRLVNGVADQSQRGKFAAPVASLAADAGLPRVLVDLRHEATHNELPSLEMLRLAADHALVWLRSHYWVPQQQAFQAQRTQLKQVLKDYLSLQVLALSVAPTGDCQIMERHFSH